MGHAETHSIKTMSKAAGIDPYKPLLALHSKYVCYYFVRLHIEVIDTSRLSLGTSQIPPFNPTTRQSRRLPSNRRKTCRIFWVVSSLAIVTYTSQVVAAAQNRARSPERIQSSALETTDQAISDVEVLHPDSHWKPSHNRQDAKSRFFQPSMAAQCQLSTTLTIRMS